MQANQASRREKWALWIALALTFALAILRIIAQPAGLQPPGFNLKALILTNLLVVASLLCLWFAYRHWLSDKAQKGALQNILGSIKSEVILVVGPDRRIRMVNESVKNIFGYEVAEAQGQTTDLLYFDRRADKRNPTEIRDAIDRFGFHIGHAVGRRRNGEVIPLEIVTTALQQGEGAVILIKDISDRAAYEKNINEARHLAELANAEKSRLLAEIERNYARLKELEKLRDDLTHMIVHDMRTPLQVVLGTAELLTDTPAQPLHEDDRRLLDGVIEQARVLVGMVNNMLDLSRLESGQFPIKTADCLIVELFQEAMDATAGICKNHVVSIEDTSTLPMVSCDREVIRRILVNLITNAVKYTPPGGAIRLGAALEIRFIRLKVIDSGPGIKPEMRERIFEKFGMGDSKKYSKMHSAGLGLAFCKLAVEAHGGTIGVDNNEGSPGANFWFRLPLAGPMGYGFLRSDASPLGDDLKIKLG